MGAEVGGRPEERVRVGEQEAEEGARSSKGSKSELARDYGFDSSQGAKGDVNVTGKL